MHYIDAAKEENNVCKEIALKYTDMEYYNENKLLSGLVNISQYISVGLYFSQDKKKLEVGYSMGGSDKLEYIEYKNKTAYFKFDTYRSGSSSCTATGGSITIPIDTENIEIDCVIR